jgi:hypothetical protein
MSFTSLKESMSAFVADGQSRVSRPDGGLVFDHISPRSVALRPGYVILGLTSNLSVTSNFIAAR